MPPTLIKTIGQTQPPKGFDTMYPKSLTVKGLTFGQPNEGASPNITDQSIDELSKATVGLDLLQNLYNNYQTTPKSQRGHPIMGRLEDFSPAIQETLSPEKSVLMFHFNTAKQIIGKFLEGGVLRLEDEKKYEKIIPKPNDPPAVFEAKVLALTDVMKDLYKSRVNILGASGRDVSNLPDLSSFKITTTNGKEVNLGIANKYKNDFKNELGKQWFGIYRDPSNPLTGYVVDSEEKFFKAKQNKWEKVKELK